MSRFASVILSLFVLLFSALINVTNAQYKVTINIISLPVSPVADQIYISGNFNNWDPAEAQSRFRKNEKGQFYYEVPDVPANTYQFKFTRGSWETGETNSMGAKLPNRELVLNSDTTLNLIIEGWQDANSPMTDKKISTAGPQVSVIDPVFKMPELDRTRRIWIYLPASYTESKETFPVLYMHDGQNLFDELTSYAGEWGADETMDQATKKWIIVGIDNGGEKRMNEYNPLDHEKFGKGEGKEYLEFLVKDLKPFIDSHYRTKKEAKHTAIAGSSMGALISFYAGIWHPKIFGSIGVFSPSFWINPNISETVESTVNKKNHRSQHYYFYCGQQEGTDMVTGTEKISGLLKEKTGVAYPVNIDPNGKHNEYSWKTSFPGFLAYINEF